ncbi:MAG: alternative ribosome rescue aminoacyl-tRNA hydrolase ArfB [Planctomycetota bacterium]
MEDLVVKPGLTLPAAALELSAARSGGPGGQHVNKTSSKVVVKLDLEACGEALSDAQRARLRTRVPPRFQTQDGRVLVVTCDEHRDQLRNREDALAKLAEVLREALKRPKTRLATKPTRASQERRLKQKDAKGKKKQDRRRSDWD